MKTRSSKLVRFVSVLCLAVWAVAPPRAAAQAPAGLDLHLYAGLEVLRGIYCAVTRRTTAGTPEEGWYPENRISVESALAHFTRDAAYASFQETEKRRLSVGKLADFTVISEDILSLPPARLLKAKVLLTVMGGRTTFRSSD